MANARPKFLNVDLEVESAADLEPLVAAMAGGAFDLAKYRRRGRYHVRFELNRTPTNADQAIRAFARLLRRLPPRVRRLWNAARRRDFDIGMDAPDPSDCAMLELSDEAVQLAGMLGARIVFTVYGQNWGLKPSKRIKPTRRAK